MIRKKCYIAVKTGLLTLGMAILFSGHTEAAGRKTIYNSPYVSFSPDGRAFTTCAGDRNYTWYAEEDSTTVFTGIQSSLRSLRTGEHYYKTGRYDSVPVGYWKVVHRTGQCIHNEYSVKDWHGVSFGSEKCFRYYYSGWKAFCADCGEPLEEANIYMSREAAESIQYLHLSNEGEPVSYYYLCPFCNNLEQGVSFSTHWCKNISWNQYTVIYKSNTDIYSGYMSNSYHMYDNATNYEGKTVTPVTHLTENNYTREGYVFTGWNTRADGSGISFTDKAEICNLSSADWRDQTTWTAEDNGSVILYAQWKRCESTLVIDANGGKYNGRNTYSFTKPYGSKYVPQKGLIDAPAGYAVTFETNGGTKTGTVTGKTHFVEWMRMQPFQGHLANDAYMFMAPDGNTDILKASYQSDPITLPATTRTGWSFGGWYYDPEFHLPAGGAGATIIPSKEMTLYAQWIDLKLQAADNYTVNDGKGAVDLSWSQSDQNNKTYLVYQKREDGAWLRINSANDIGSTTVIDRAYVFDGRVHQYTVPHTGLYTINALGAQGQSYGSYTGGYGGSVSGTFWLQKGEVLTYTTGGQNGYNGGGRASEYGNGGGMTSVLSDRKGILLIAGGGGGAAVSGPGRAGGSMESVILERRTGEDGMAGGGAGYYGGTAGEKIVHHHTNTCYKDTSYAPGLGNWDYMSYGYSCYGDTVTPTGYSGHTNDDYDYSFIIVRAGWSRSYFPSNTMWDITGYQGIPTNGNTTLNLSYNCTGWGGLGSYICDLNPHENDASAYTILDQNGTKIAEGNFRDYPHTKNYHYDSSQHVGISDFSQSLNIDLPEGTTHVFVTLKFRLTGSVWVGADITDLSFSGGRALVCGYEEGQVISSRPAYGGSNYISPFALWHERKNGVRSGSGLGRLRSEAIGYQESLSLAGVTATDFAAPEKIADQVTREPLDGRTIRVVWREPKDRGTDYYHKVESYLTGSTSMLCESNITKNTLVSGVKGYYYLVDADRNTSVTGNADYVRESQVTVAMADHVQYLHIAAVDAAGNIGGTTHIRINEKDVLWKIYTKQLTMDASVENVYPAAADKTWYVRADGSTPFTLQNEAYMEGTASPEYQLNETIYETVAADGSLARNIIRTPLTEIADTSIRTEADNLAYATTGITVLRQYPYSYTIRSRQNRELTGVQQFVIDGKYSGQRIQVIPVAGAGEGAKKTYSVHAQDERNKITLIADGEAPVIHGMEILEKQERIDRRDGSVTVRARAEDGISGIRKFYLAIHNTDNAISKTYTPGKDGYITITITDDDPVFSGDFTVSGYAVDNVGNECSCSYGTTEFALESSVERVLEPREPVFKCGESGILNFTTWGYVDRVEVIFPECMTSLDPTLNRVYDYTETPGYRITEELPFMVPLYTPENRELEITVRAYKGDKKLEDHPTISVIGVSGTVLDELRTRLR